MASPRRRALGNAHLTPARLLDPAERAPELELIEQLEREGHDVAGAKVRILALRQAERQAQDLRAAIRRVGDFGTAEQGLNVPFDRPPNPGDPLEQRAFAAQLPHAYAVH